MFDDDEKRDEEETGDDDGRTVRHEVEAEEREERRTNDGGERDIAGEENDDEEDGEGASRRGWGECEEDAESAGDAFASTKAEPDGEDVAEDGGDCGDDGEIVVAGGDVLGDFDGEEGFAAVEKKRGDAKAFGAGACDVGGADVAAAGCADVLLAEDFDEKVAKGDGAQKIRERNGDEPGVHGRLDEFSKLA